MRSVVVTNYTHSNVLMYLLSGVYIYFRYEWSRLG